MTLAKRTEFLETLGEVARDLLLLKQVVEDPKSTGDIREAMGALGSLRGGVESLEEQLVGVQRSPMRLILSAPGS
jgi:hypothetical protein